MHVSNFGVFASAERNLIFAINDFDETASRALGVGPQAAGRERRRGGELHRRRQGAAPRRRRARCVRVLPQAHAALCRDGLPAGLVRPHRRACGARRAVARAAAQRRARHGQGAGQGPRAVARKAHRGGRRRAPHHRGRPADRARDPYRCRHAGARGARRDAARLHRVADPSTAGRCCRATGSSTPRARSSAWAASAPAAGWSCCRASTTTIRCSCRSRRPSHRCWRPTSDQAAVPPTRASAWSSASA